MLQASTPIQPPPSASSSSRAAPPAGFALSSLSSSTSSSPAHSPSLDSPPISGFAKRYRATPLPTPMAESMPVTPLSSAGASSPSTSSAVAHDDDVEDEDFEAGGEVTLVKRNTGKGYRYQRKGEVVDGQSQGQTRERRSSSSSSGEERKRASAAEKVETSRIKARAARLAEQEKEAREQQEEEQARRQQELEGEGEGEGEGGTDSRASADPVVSYAQQMQNHMLSLMKGMEAIQVGSGFVKKQQQADE